MVELFHNTVQWILVSVRCLTGSEESRLLLELVGPLLHHQGDVIASSGMQLGQRGNPRTAAGLFQAWKDLEDCWLGGEGLTVPQLLQAGWTM